MTPIIESSLGPNGFEAIVTCDPSPSTLNSSTIDTIGTAASKARPLYRPSKRPTTPPSCYLHGSNHLPLITRPMAQFLSSVSSEVTESWMSLENILSFLNPLSIRMSGPKSSLPYTKSRSTSVMTWLLVFHTNYQHGSLQILKMGNLCIDTS
jgi:hypothetical protein